MKIKIFLIALIIIGLSPNSFNQFRFRSGVFLHHSTGLNIWGPNGSSTSIPQEMTAYNNSHNFTDSNTVTMNEVWFPGSGSGNEWWEWHWIFDNLDQYGNDVYPYIENNKIVVIKSCFPSSNIEGYGSPDDTSGANITKKTIYNYKWHWRSIVKIMEEYPMNFFVIWTNAPQEENSTNPNEALLSDQFCTWAKDTLAAGLDPTYGAFPPNVYVFDFFHKLAGPNGIMQSQYRTQPGDSHPNAAATALVAPQFVQEIFDAAIAYETIIPVEMTLFEGSYEDGAVNLTWVTATETNNFGFEVERRSGSSNYEKIGFVSGNGTTTNRVTFNFVDKNLLADKYYYRLKQIDLDGTIEYSNEIMVEINTLEKFQLFQNYPNPFNPSTTLSFAISQPSFVSLKIFDVLGNEVATLVNEYKSEGRYEVEFGVKSGVRELSSGVYFSQLKFGDFIKTNKMLLLK